MKFSRYIRMITHPSGDGEIRTLDPLLARQVLSQLSYAPGLDISQFLTAISVCIPECQHSYMHSRMAHF